MVQIKIKALDQNSIWDTFSTRELFQTLFWTKKGFLEPAVFLEQAGIFYFRGHIFISITRDGLNVEKKDLRLNIVTWKIVNYL